MRYYLLVIAAIAYLAYVSSDACVQCNSSNDVRCATKPEQFLAKDCTNTTSKCYTRVQNGDTIRGCSADLDTQTQSKCSNENECVICSFVEGCNRQIFPSHRLQCIQCEGNSTGTCATDVRASSNYCPIYRLGDKCYIRNNNRNNTNSFRRGCLSSIQNEKLCVKDGNCYTCDGVGCNNLEFNDTHIPIARDSVSALTSSLGLILVAFALVHKF